MLLQFAAALVATQRFEEVSIAKLLARASCLETPADYISFLQEPYKPARNVKLVIEEVAGAHHWREFFGHLGMHFAGLTGTRTTADAAHLLHVVRRDSVKSCVPGIPFEEDGQGQGSDPVLLAKHWLCSKALSQPPTVLLEGDLGLDFSKLPRMVAPRTLLTDESAKQYRRTGAQVLEAPWQLEAAAAYLMSWLQRNAGQAQQQPLPEISFIVEGREFLPASLVAPATWKDFAPNGAIPVRPVPRNKLSCGGLQLLVLCHNWLMSVAGPKLLATWLLNSKLPNSMMVRNSLMRTSLSTKRLLCPTASALSLEMKLLQTHLQMSLTKNMKMMALPLSVAQQ